MSYNDTIHHGDPVPVELMPPIALDKVEWNTDYDGPRRVYLQANGHDVVSIRDLDAGTGTATVTVWTRPAGLEQGVEATTVVVQLGPVLRDMEARA